MRDAISMELAEAAPTSSLLRLARVAAQTTSFLIVDHRSCVDFQLPPPSYSGTIAPRPTALPRATYYLAGVNERQRQIYDEHCAERFAQRSPYHYSSRDDVEEKLALAGSMWRQRQLHEIRGAFVGLDGLVAQPPPSDEEEDAPAAYLDGAAAAAAAAARVGRIFTFEALPGFNGLGRLMLALEQLGLATIAPAGGSVALKPRDLTASRFAAARRAHGDELPPQRGIENVHAFTYAKTFPPPANSSDGDGLSAHRCLFVVDQFWTVNFWHWTTDALPKALLFAESVRERHPRCRLLTYDFPWTRQYLALLGLSAPETAVYYKPSTLYFGCKVLVPSPSALDGTNRQQLLALRSAILPHASTAMATAAAAAGASTRRQLVLLHFRPGKGGSVHGDGRTLTNLPELHEAMALAFKDAESSIEVVLLDHTGMSVAEQAALYSRAVLIVGVHGAGFANVLWATPGAHVVEIVPVDVHLDFQCGLTPFWLVSELLGLRKHAFIAYSGRMFEPFELPVLEFVAFLKASAIVPWRGPSHAHA